MGFDAPDTTTGATRRAQILRAAYTEFLTHGFRDASLRRIAAAAGCSVSNLYGYYPHKDALFCAVIEPIREDFDTFSRSFIEADKELSNRRDMLLSEVFEEGMNMGRHYLDYTYAHYDDLRLLFVLSTGSSLDGAAEDYIAHNLAITNDYIDADDTPNTTQLRDVSPQLLRLLTAIPTQYLIQVLTSNISREQAETDLSVLYTFLLSGYNSVLHWWPEGPTHTPDQTPHPTQEPNHANN